MKLYFYSHRRQVMVHAAWIPFAVTAGILVFTILILGLMRLNHSMGFVSEGPSVGPLTVENGILQRHLSLLSPRVHALETNMRIFRDRFDGFNAVLSNHEALRVRGRYPRPVAPPFVSIRFPVTSMLNTRMYY